MNLHLVLIGSNELASAVEQNIRTAVTAAHRRDAGRRDDRRAGCANARRSGEPRGELRLDQAMTWST